MKQGDWVGGVWIPSEIKVSEKKPKKVTKLQKYKLLQEMHFRRKEIRGEVVILQKEFRSLSQRMGEYLE